MDLKDKRERLPDTIEKFPEFLNKLYCDLRDKQTRLRMFLFIGSELKVNTKRLNHLEIIERINNELQQISSWLNLQTNLLRDVEINIESIKDKNDIDHKLTYFHIARRIQLTISEINITSTLFNECNNLFIELNQGDKT
jgi:two-component sensor histidine kinase